MKLSFMTHAQLERAVKRSLNRHFAVEIIRSPDKRLGDSTKAFVLRTPWFRVALFK